MDGVIETVDLGICLELFERDDGLESMLRSVRGRLKELSSCPRTRTRTRTGVGGSVSCDVRNDDDLSASEDSESSEDHHDEEKDKSS